MDAAGLGKAALVGHSWGSLIAMEAAATLQDRISHLVLVGTAFPMKVSPALLESALHTPEQAIQLVNTFSRATLAPPNGSGQLGVWCGHGLGPPCAGQQYRHQLAAHRFYRLRQLSRR